MKKETGIKVIAIFITLFIVIILLLTGPANAYILGLNVLNKEVFKGENINFTASTQIEIGEFLKIDYFILKLNGPMSVECMFHTNGSIINSCPGITIKNISSAPYNFGYGYGTGLFEYNITLDTSYYFPGQYSTSLVLVDNGNRIEQSGDNITIKTMIDELLGCSIRAEDGNLMAEGMDFGDGEISFYIPLGNADVGEGHLTGQKGRNRLSYDFNIIDILINTPGYAEILVSGKYKIGRGAETPETSIIHFDKISNQITLTGTNVLLGTSDIGTRSRC